MIAPGPHLTIWGSEQTAPTGAGQSEGRPSVGCSLADFYETVMGKTRSMRREAEDWLVGAYRQQTYSQVREFAQFATRLKRADGLVLARTEFIYDRIMVLPNRYTLAHVSFFIVCS